MKIASNILYRKQFTLGLIGSDYAVAFKSLIYNTHYQMTSQLCIHVHLHALGISSSLWRWFPKSNFIWLKLIAIVTSWPNFHLFISQVYVGNFHEHKFVNSLQTCLENFSQFLIFTIYFLLLFQQTVPFCLQGFCSSLVVQTKLSAIFILMNTHSAFSLCHTRGT